MKCFWRGRTVWKISAAMVAMLMCWGSMVYSVGRHDVRCSELLQSAARLEINAVNMQDGCAAQSAVGNSQAIAMMFSVPEQELTEEELVLLSRVISAEARGESYEGQVAVGAVVLNRVKSKDFPDSVEEVCWQPGAFSGVENGQIFIEPSESCRAAAEAAARGEDPTGGAVFFYNPQTARSEWILSRPVVAVIGDHCFCT